MSRIPTSTSSTSDASALRHFVQSMPAAVALIDHARRLQAWSARWGRLFGLAAAAEEEAPAFFDVIAEQEPWPDVLQQGLDGEVGQGTAVLRLRDGKAAYRVEWEVRPWPAGTDDVEGVLLAVTGRMPRRGVEDHFQALADTVDEGVLLMGRSGTFQACNARAEQILGRPSNTIVGSSFREAQWRGLHEDGTPLPSERFPLWVACSTAEPIRDYVMGVYPEMGPPRWIRVNAQPLFLDDGHEPYAVLASFTDITAQKLNDEALRVSEDLLAGVLASSLDGIMVLTAVRNAAREIVDFEWLLVNPKAEELMGQPSGALIGQRLLEVVPSYLEEAFFEAYVEVVETGAPFERELFYSQGAHDAWFQVVAVKLNDGVAVTFRDISARKQAAQSMAAANAELAQRNQTLHEFAYIASHDLQEPLRKISAFADLMGEEYGEAVDETGAYYLERMQDAAQRMSTLISDLLAYARITTQAQSFVPVDLNEVFADVCSDLSLRIQEVDGRVVAQALPGIEADPTQMHQLLQNLIGNALKFHRRGVPPVVRVRAVVERAEGPLGLRVCRLTVQDNGIGMEEKYVDRIFTPFKRLHNREQYQGSGVGLAICQRIVERHGGHIAVASTPGEGTTFTVTLPVNQHNGSDTTS